MSLCAPGALITSLHQALALMQRACSISGLFSCSGSLEHLLVAGAKQPGRPVKARPSPAERAGIIDIASTWVPFAAAAPALLPPRVSPKAS